MAATTETEEWPGALAHRYIGDQVLVLYPMIFTYRLCIGPADDHFDYNRAWCYERLSDALAALTDWDGEGSPPFGWIKEVGT